MPPHCANKQHLEKPKHGFLFFPSPSSLQTTIHLTKSRKWHDLTRFQVNTNKTGGSACWILFTDSTWVQNHTLITILLLYSWSRAISSTLRNWIRNEATKWVKRIPLSGSEEISTSCCILPPWHGNGMNKIFGWGLLYVFHFQDNDDEQTLLRKRKV